MVTHSFGKKIVKIDKNLEKKQKFIFNQIHGFFAITFEPETPESHSKVQKTRIIA